MKFSLKTIHLLCTLLQCLLQYSLQGDLLGQTAPSKCQILQRFSYWLRPHFQGSFQERLDAAVCPKGFY